jgi:hypothetical protein
LEVIYPSHISIVVGLKDSFIHQDSEIVDARQAVALTLSVDRASYDSEQVKIAVNQACQRLLGCFH